MRGKEAGSREAPGKLFDREGFARFGRDVVYCAAKKARDKHLFALCLRT